MNETARVLLRQPRYALTVVALIGAGVGICAGMFTLYDVVRLRPLPYAADDRLYVIQEYRRPAAPQQAATGSSASSYLKWADDAESLAGTAAAWSLPRGIFVTIDRHSEVVQRATVTPEFFSVLGTGPVLGTASGGFVISDRYWQRRFGRDPHVLGKLVIIEGGRGLAPVPIVGVMPPGVDLPAGVDLWSEATLSEPPSPARRAHRPYLVIARLEPGVSAGASTAELSLLQQQLARDYPDTHANWIPRLIPLRAYVFGHTTGIARTIHAASLLFLGIVIVNLMLLIIARTDRQRADDAIRQALGADASRILRQTGAEWLLFAALSALIAVPVGFVIFRILVFDADFLLPSSSLATFDGRTIVWTLALVAGTISVLGLVSSSRRLAPLQLGSTRGLQPLVAGISQGRSLVWLLMAQATTAVLLSTVAVSLLTDLTALSNVRLGVESESALTVELRHPIVWSGDDSNAWPSGRFVETNRQILDRVRRLPGVESAGLVSDLPIVSRAGANLSYWPNPGAVHGDTNDAILRTASPGYFSAIGVPFITGRDFDNRMPASSARDGSIEPPEGVVVVSDSLRRRHWPDRDPVGEIIILNERSGPRQSRIVGVVDDVVHDLSAPKAPAATIYVPYWEQPADTTILVLRARSDFTLESDVRAAIAGLGDRVAIAKLESLTHRAAALMAPLRFSARTAAIFAVLAVILSGVGIFAVVSYLSSRRRRELAIRAALGANPLAITLLLAKDALIATSLGIAVGAMALGLMARTSWLPGVVSAATLDASIPAGCAFVAAVVALSTLWPALTAGHRSPLPQLRLEA